MTFISIGNCNKYYIYLLVGFVCEFFMKLLFGLNSSNRDHPVRIFSFKAKLKDHKLLKNFIRFVSILLGSLILYLIEKRNKEERKSRMSIETAEKMEYDYLNKKREYKTLKAVIIGVIFSLYIIFKDFIDLTGVHLGFWTIEIMYICIMSYFIFKIKIYIHRKIAMYLMIFLVILEFSTFFLPTTKHETPINELTDKNVFDITIIKYGVWAIPVIFIAFELKNMQRDFCWIEAKYLMDVKSYPASKIFLYIGIIGIIFVSICFPILTYFPCKSFNNIEKVDKNYINLETGETLKLYLEYCQLSDYDENSKTLHLVYDSFKLILKEYSNTDKTNMIELFVLIPLFFILNLINEIIRLMIVKYLDPNNILIYKNFNYFFQRIIVMIINKGDEQYLTYLQFFLIQLEEFLSIICSMIYIEVLELNFCGFDYELKKNIDKRGDEDINADFDLMRKDTELSVELPESKSINESKSQSKITEI